MTSSTPLIEIGNSTIKWATVDRDGSITIERFGDIDSLLQRCEGLSSPLICAPVGEMSDVVISALRETHSVRVLGREGFREFVGDSYLTPETLGLDRILNLRGLSGDGLVISCGTAITIDAISNGRPYWGAIMPGFRTAAEGLHARVPALPLVSLDTEPRLPATTSYISVTNGVILGTARAAQAIASELLAVAFKATEAKIVLTGGDAELLLRLWKGDTIPAIDEALLFRGIGEVNDEG